MSGTKIDPCGQKMSRSLSPSLDVALKRIYIESWRKQMPEPKKKIDAEKMREAIDLWKGWEAFQSYVGLSVVTFNLQKIAALI